ncbi:hypothetical protein G6F65_015434 [Rhizopus arrhizus]|nr:hypothetical protein G6F31_016011 [Rhizopus arrhizus]KAG1258924.1 hypothetical protein G6F65_015434 [Rhizopus arrhizus]
MQPAAQLRAHDAGGRLHQGRGSLAPAGNRGHRHLVPDRRPHQGGVGGARALHQSGADDGRSSFRYDCGCAVLAHDGHRRGAARADARPDPDARAGAGSAGVPGASRSNYRAGIAALAQPAA